MNLRRDVSAWVKIRQHSERAVRVALIVAAGVALVMALLPHPPRFPGEPSDKIQHVMAFAVLGALGALGYPLQSIRALVLRLALFGALIEALQAIPMLHRDSDPIDLLADIVAALVAAWLVRRVFGPRDGEGAKR